MPFKEPSKEPSKEPFQEPSKEPFQQPSKEPFQQPSKEPFQQPSQKSSQLPYQKPQLHIDADGRKFFVGYSTAYLARGKTSRMGPARFGVVAVDPKLIPYRTKLFIEGYGHCVAGDLCGAACKGKVLVDVCFKTAAQCRAWGRRKVKVYIL